MKILLVLSDGLRPDAIAEHPVTKILQIRGTYCMDAQTVTPAVTGLFEQLAKKGRKCAMFYNWEELRDVTRPDNLCRSEYVSGRVYGGEAATKESFAAAKKRLKNSDIDFAFLYLGWTDSAGHKFGWLSEEYMRAANETGDMLSELIEELGKEYTIIFTADHGGHDRWHGIDIPEDMTIPLFFLGEPFAAGREERGLNIKDIAPTIASLLDAEIPEEWEGRIVR